MLINKDISKLMQEETIFGFGHLEIFPDKNVKVNSWNEYIFTYKCVKEIMPGGSLRITIPHFFTSPQTEDKFIVGYTCLAEENEVKSEITINPIYSCSFGKDGHSGRFGKSVFIKFLEGVKRGKKVVIKYGAKNSKNPGARAPFFACTAYFITAIDPYGDRRAPISGYYLLEEQAGFQVYGGWAKKAIIFIPSITQDQSGKGIIQLTDLNENIDSNFEGEIFLFPTNNGVNLPKKISFLKKDKGKKEFYFINNLNKDFRVEAISSEGDVLGISNFCVGKRDDKYNVYWGDYHVHTYASDGLGTIKEALDYARNEAVLDFGAVTDHLGFSEKVWDIIKKEVEETNIPEKFVTFFGFEVTTYPNICDYCVLIKNPEELDIRELLRYVPNIKTDKFYRILSEHDVIIIPHFHLGKGKIWNYKAPSQMRLAEIYSCWGNHEYDGCALPSYGLPFRQGKRDKNTIHELLKNGYRCGFVAGSDSHSGQGGKAFWLRTKQRYKGGLTAIIARELTRESLWEALKSRRVYATTGARIFLDFKINREYMGSEIKVKKGTDINISFKVNGTKTTFLTQIIKNGRIWRSYDVSTYPYPPEPGREGILEKEVVDEKILKSAYYYLRVTQIDGEIAWSSPIWVDVVD